MKSAPFILAAAAALAQAQKPPGDDVPINCAKPNANYCMAGDIILRCDENAMGIAGRCSPNLSGYPPSGGIASCWQSSEEAGDAACEKNCVVYPEPPEPAFTLAGDECTPSHTVTPTHPAPNSTVTTKTTVTISTCDHGCTETHPPPPPPPPPTNGTWLPTETHPPSPSSPSSHPPSPSSPSSHPPPPPPPPPSTNGTLVPTETYPPPPPPPGTTGGGGEEPTNVPIPPTTTVGEVEPIPTGAAAANKVGVLLAAAGFAAAYLI